MEMSLLETLLSKISWFSNLSSFENINSELFRKYYRRAEGLLNLLKPIILNATIASDEAFTKASEEFGLLIEDLQQQFESWQPLSSRVYLVLQVEALLSKIQNSSLDIFKFLKSSNQHLPYELSLASLEEIEHVGDEQASSLIKEAIRDQADSVGPSLEALVRIAESLSLTSNQEILLEVVALAELKENAEIADKTAEVEGIDQLIALVTLMHDQFVLIKKSQTSSPVPIPFDFICPLSLEPMTDPVIVASGQTYERTFIKKWFDLGLTVCPKTRQKLTNTYLVPNYTIKALVANWCEVNNLKLPDLMKSSLNQPYPLLVHAKFSLLKDSNSFLNSRSNHSMSPKSQSTTSQPDHMGMSLLEILVRNISSIFNLSSRENINSEPVQKYCQRTEEILKLLKPIILEEIFDSKITSDEVLTKTFEEMSFSIEELREQLESWQPLLSKIYFILQVESLISKIQNSILDIFHFLKSSNQHLPYELSSASLEHYLQKIKQVGEEQTSSVIEEAIRDQLDNSGPREEILVIIAERLSLKTNQEALMEAVALEKLKENAEQADKTAEVAYIDKLIALVTRMHHRIVLIKQSQTSSPVLITSDFICPLSLELMADPVIVASGQTYERTSIKRWIDLGLTMCPKTRQKLTHTSLISNYTVKALISNWCESNNVMLPDKMKSSLNQPYPLLVHAKFGLPKDSNSFLNSRSNHPMSPKSQSTSQSETLFGNISSIFNLSSRENINSEPVQKYYQRTKEILELLKPIILEEIFDSKITSDEVLTKAFEELSFSIEELREQFESWQPLLSKIYFVLHVESLISKIQNSCLDIFHFLKSSNQHLPYELSLASLEYYLQKIKHVGDEQTSSIIEEAIRDRLDNSGPRAEILVIIAERLSLNSNQETLMEAVALEKLKENAEQAGKIAEVEYIDKFIALVTRMRHRIILIKLSQTSGPVLIPSDFICPLSLELMTDPVIVASGQTYERTFIKKWIDIGLTMCPKTRQMLSHFYFIPNYILKSQIANWCESNNVKLPGPMFMSLNAPYPHRESEVKNLVEGLKSTSIDTQREATAQLRFLSKQNRDNRIIITNFGAISLLVDLLRSPDTKTQENTVTALLNLSNIDSNKTAIANANAIEPLIHVLETGSPVAKENTAATLFSLSVIEDNKVKIGRLGAIRPLVDLLRNGTPRGKKDAATALFNLSRFHENKARIVQAGAVRYLVDLMHTTAGMVDKAVFVLAKLSTIPEGRTAIEQQGGIPMLVEVVETGSARGKENAAAALLHLCICSPRVCNLVLREGAVPSLVELSHYGTPRAKEKAQAFISHLQNTRHGYAGRS